MPFGNDPYNSSALLHYRAYCDHILYGSAELLQESFKNIENGTIGNAATDQISNFYL